MKKTVLITVLLFTFSHIGLAQTNFDKTKWDYYFNALEENNKFMGSIADSKNGEISYTKTIGFADIENNKKTNENSYFFSMKKNKTQGTIR
ncbi:MAG: hypothetical protein ACP5KD_09045 [Fervidobacterium sp.]|jgi:hypothetical protein